MVRRNNKKKPGNSRVVSGWYYYLFYAQVQIRSEELIFCKPCSRDQTQKKKPVEMKNEQFWFGVEYLHKVTGTL